MDIEKPLSAPTHSPYAWGRGWSCSVQLTHSHVRLQEQADGLAYAYESRAARLKRNDSRLSLSTWLWFGQITGWAKGVRTRFR